MGKTWDNHTKYTARTEKGKATLDALNCLGLEAWEAGFVAFTVDWASLAIKVLRPGAMGLVWALPRTSDLTGLGLRLAGFEVRDNLYHLFGSGMPKGHNISKAVDHLLGAERGKKQIAWSTNVLNGGIGVDRPWKEQAAANGHHEVDDDTPVTSEAKAWDGYNVVLKPAVEEWLLIMKPLDGTYAANALAHGVAGLWVDGVRIETTGKDKEKHLAEWDRKQSGQKGATRFDGLGAIDLNGYAKEGRWPANLILSESAAALLDEQSGESKSSGGTTRKNSNFLANNDKDLPFHNYGDTGGASRYFTVLPDEVRFCYTAKASTSERNEGLDHIEAHQRDASRNADQPSMNGGEGNPYNRGAAPVQNSHPTVKPLNLLRWLVKLTRTPAGGHVLDPFAGSGTTGVACLLEGRECTLIEREPEYVTIARHRLEHWQDEASIEPRKIKGKDKDFDDMPLFAEVNS